MRFYEGFTENKNINGPWLARAAVREAKLHGVDYIKIYTTQDFAGTMHMWRPDATLVNSPSLTLEEVEAIVDEAHRLGLRVACHAYGGEGMDSCIKAGVDAPNHLLMLDDAGVKILLEKKLPYVPDHRRPDRARAGRSEGDGRQATRACCCWNSRAEGGRGRRSDRVRQRRHLARHPRTASRRTSSATYVKWGLSPVQALQTAYLPAAKMLNYDWDKEIGTIEKGKFADIIAVVGKPAHRHQRNGTGQVRDEGRSRRAKRPLSAGRHPTTVNGVIPGSPLRRTRNSDGGFVRSRAPRNDLA